MDEEIEKQSPYGLFGPAEDGKASDLLAGKSEVDARIRLQALIAEWLRMENLPFAHLLRSFQIRLSAPQTFLLVLGYECTLSALRRRRPCSASGR